MAMTRRHREGVKAFPTGIIFPRGRMTPTVLRPTRKVGRPAEPCRAGGVERSGVRGQQRHTPLTNPHGRHHMQGLTGALRGTAAATAALLALSFVSAPTGAAPARAGAPGPAAAT